MAGSSAAVALGTEVLESDAIQKLQSTSLTQPQIAAVCSAVAASLQPGTSKDVEGLDGADAAELASVSAACASVYVSAGSGRLDATALAQACEDGGLAASKTSALVTAYAGAREGILSSLATSGAAIERVVGMDWRADQLRRSTSGAAVNEPMLVFSLTTEAVGAGPGEGKGKGVATAAETSTVTFAAGRQEAEALLRSVTEALAAADRIVEG